MAKLQKLTALLIGFGVAGLSLSTHAQESANTDIGSTADARTTKKTQVTGDGYFRYGISQDGPIELPYVTCVGEEDCPVRTSKTIAQRELPKTVKPIEFTASDTNKVYFDFAKSKITQLEVEHVKEIASRIKDQKVIHLRAFTDPVGGMNSSANRRLARARALTVKGMFQALGIGKHAKYIIEYNPPCCNQPGVTANSSDNERKNMRVVEIS